MSAAESRRGDWCQTFTGRVFWPLDPRPEDVCIEDIAHALALQCRFAGHCRSFYSVAQHSVLVSRIVSVQFDRLALLHDRAEAYCLDLPRPIKRSPEMSEYRVAYRVCEMTIDRALGLVWTPGAKEAVKRADNVMLATEAEILMVRPPPAPWNLPERSHPDPLLRIEIANPWGPVRAEHEFLARFREVTR